MLSFDLVQLHAVKGLNVGDGATPLPFFFGALADAPSGVMLIGERLERDGALGPIALLYAWVDALLEIDLEFPDALPGTGEAEHVSQFAVTITEPGEFHPLPLTVWRGEAVSPYAFNAATALHYGQEKAMPVAVIATLQ
ncbi:hypothetical protein KUL72_24805 [Bradyrhizobium arachidis]|nr:hypothetical protein [Bradyrhizobium arachidis]UVO34673.1 hypothetical protein KUL72_24805 [Bradyrhizobium arachidis]